MIAEIAPVGIANLSQSGASNLDRSWKLQSGAIRLSAIIFQFGWTKDLLIEGMLIMLPNFGFPTCVKTRLLSDCRSGHVCWWFAVHHGEYLWIGGTNQCLQRLIDDARADWKNWLISPEYEAKQIARVLRGGPVDLLLTDLESQNAAESTTPGSVAPFPPPGA